MYESKDNLWEEKCIGQTISKQFEQTIIFQKLLLKKLIY